MDVARRHVMITASDANCGDFLTDHWWPSLRDNVNLSNIDVVVLDYGLTEIQREKVNAAGILRRLCVKDGAIPCIALRDTKALLLDSDYDQVGAFDGGDIIFQTDISHLFGQDQDRYRAVCEEVDSSMHGLFMSRDDFSPASWHQISSLLRGKPIINRGVIFASVQNWIAIATAYETLAKSYQHYGSDQVVVNYVLYSQGYVSLETRYNFCLITAKSEFRVVEGRFYDRQGNLIPVVHNAGGKDRYRTIRRFGYGPNCNQRKRLMPALLHAMFCVINLAKKMWLGLTAAARPHGS